MPELSSDDARTTDDPRLPASGSDGDDRAGNGIQVIARAAAILRVLEAQPEGLSLGQIAQSVGLARSTVQRIVAALSAEDFVAADGPGSVRLGPGLVRIAAAVGSNTAELVRPHLRNLGEEAGETVDLAVLSGGSAVFVDQVAGRQRLLALSAVGERFPLHCTANGKAILACFSRDDAAELIERSLAEHPDHPLVDRAGLEAELDLARGSHLAFDHDEHSSGISAVGTALLDPFGRPLAISIPVPSQRFAERSDALARTLLAFRDRMRPVISR